MRNICLVVLVLASANVALAAETNDGAIIANSGSTNTLGYEIKLWSNGKAQITMNGGAPRAFRIDDDLASRFFSNLAAARANPGVSGHCMKSASFGTSTNVTWHGWSSFDLQCPPLSPAMMLLNTDVRQVQATANIDTRRRIRLPGDVRMIPTAAPEVTPT